MIKANLGQIMSNINKFFRIILWNTDQLALKGYEESRYVSDMGYYII